MSDASGASVVGASPLQSTVIFTVEYFYNGMLDITGVEGAPDLPTEVVTPTVPITNPLHFRLFESKPNLKAKLIKSSLLWLAIRYPMSLSSWLRQESSRWWFTVGRR